MEQGLVEAPKPIQAFLLRFGGWNPYKAASYRLVLAQSVMQQEGGNFLIWPETSTLADRGGIRHDPNQFNEPTAIRSDTRPIRVEHGLKWVKKYPGMEGWILERWYPASCYGTKEVWYSKQHCLEDGTPLLGPYPEKGCYEAVTDVAAEAPTESELKNVIMFIESSVANRTGTMASRVARRVNQAEYKAQMQEEKAKKENFLRLRDESSFIYETGPAAGRKREEVAQRLRARGLKIGHVGN